MNMLHLMKSVFFSIPSGFELSRNFSDASWFRTRVGNVEMMRPGAAAGATPNCGGDWAWSAAVTFAAAGNTHLVRTSKNRTVAHASRPAVFSWVNQISGHRSKSHQPELKSL